MLNLSELTEPALIDTDLGGAERHSVLQALASLAAHHGEIDDVGLLADRLAKREELGSTGIGHGIAVPHCRMAGLSRVVLAIGICRQALAFDALDGAPVRMFFLVISPEESPAAHLRCLAAIAHWVKDAARRDELFAIHDPVELFHRLPGSPPRTADAADGSVATGVPSTRPAEKLGPDRSPTDSGPTSSDRAGDGAETAPAGKAKIVGRAARILPWTSRSSK